MYRLPDHKFDIDAMIFKYMRSAISGFIQKAVIKLYFQTPAQDLAHWIGVNSALKRIYAWVQSHITNDVVVVDLEKGSLEIELMPGTATSHVHNNFETEDVVFKDISNSIESEDVFYDIGAYIGTYGAFTSMYLDGGEVHAFEAMPERFQVLRQNFDRNNISGEPHNIVFSDTEVTPDGLPADSQPATTMRGDDYINSNNLPIPNVMKIDVEGAEGKVVKGLSDTLSNESCRLVYIEIHPIELMDSGLTDAGIEELKNELRDHGFSVDILHERQKWKDRGQTVSQQFLKAEK